LSKAMSTRCGKASPRLKERGLQQNRWWG